jgi:hypothetical protein
MRRILALFLIILAQVFLSANAKAQTETPSCPFITILNRDGNLIPHLLRCYVEGLTLKAEVANVAPGDKPTFNWKVSPGKVISGQGTSTVTVSVGEATGQEAEVTVEVNGVSALTPQCDHRASVIIGVPELCCPFVSISCPTEPPKPGEPVTISANVAGGDPKVNLKYKWQVSAGNIVDGQGTPEIKVDTSETAGQTVTATVEVEGLPPECDRTESCSLLIIEHAPSARKFDEYGSVSRMNEEVRLDNFRVQLQEEPGSQGYIIVYGPRRISQRLKRAQKFLVEKRGIAPPRVVLINGGHNKQPKVEFWMVPTGAAPPKPDPDY